MSGEYFYNDDLREFEKLNTTTECIYELGDAEVLIILEDGTNLTRWKDVDDKRQVKFISEDLSSFTNVRGRYHNSKAEAIVALNISNISSPEYMFHGSSKLKTVSATGKMENITSLKSMFRQCNILQEIPMLNNINTENVCDMSDMFSNCMYLSNLYSLKDWDVGNVQKMNSMFEKCHNMNFAPLKDWDVSNVCDMSAMFSESQSITNLDFLEKWNTQALKNMTKMFFKCGYLHNIGGLKNWDVSNVQCMESTFEECEILLDIDVLANWDTGNVRTMKNMFLECKNLKNISVLDNWSFKNIENIVLMFGFCKKIDSFHSEKLYELLDVKGWDYMFSGTHGISTLDNYVNETVKHYLE